MWLPALQLAKDKETKKSLGLALPSSFSAHHPPCVPFRQGYLLDSTDHNL
jgi:hypothetical protein